MIFKNLQKYWYKLIDKKAYYEFKNTQNIEKSAKIFQAKYENSINEIQKRIENQKTLFFYTQGILAI